MTSTSKNQIMKRLKKSLGVTGTDVSRLDMVHNRIANPEAGTRPAFAKLAKEKRVELFTSILETLHVGCARSLV